MQDRQCNYSNDYKNKSNRKANDTFDHIASPRKAKCVRMTKHHKLIIRDKEGSLREILTADILWYLLYIRNPLIKNGYFIIFVIDSGYHMINF